MISRIGFLCFVLLLTACGGKEEPAAIQAHSRNARKIGPCSTPTIRTWQTMVAAKCRVVRSEQASQECIRGLHHFRRANPGVSCLISQKDAQWSDDDSTASVQIDEYVLTQMEEQSRDWSHRHGEGN